MPQIKKRPIMPFNDYLKNLWQKVRAAEAYHEIFVKKAKASTRILRGHTDFLPEKFDEKDIVNPNLGFSTVRNYVPALLPPFTKIYVKPNTPTWGKDEKNNLYSAILMESCINDYYKRLKMQKTNKQCILSGLIHGIGYLWDAWVFETSPVDPTIVKDQPMHKFISGIDIIPDPDGLEFEDKSFVVRTFAKRGWQMKKLGFHNIEDDSKEQIQYLSSGKPGDYNMPDAHKYYEIYDKNTNRIYTMSDTQSGGQETLHAYQDYDFKHGFPFTPMIFNPMIDNYYPLSLLQIFESVQKMMTLMATWGSYHVKRAIPKIAYLEKYIDASAKKKLASGEDMAGVPIKIPDSLNKGDVDIRKIIVNLNAPGLPSDFGSLWGLFRSIGNELSGIHEQARGGTATEKTATEANLLDSYLRARYTDYRSIVDEAIIESSEKTIRLIRENANTDQWLRFNRRDFESQYFFNSPNFQKNENLKEMGDMYFIKWNKDDISAQYDLEVGMGPGAPANEELEFKKALHKLNIARGHPLINQKNAIVEFYRDLKHPHPESMVIPPSPPQKDQPKVALSVKLEDLEGDLNDLQTSILGEAGLLPKQQPMPGGPSGPGAPGMTPGADVALGNELQRPGLEFPPQGIEP